MSDVSIAELPINGFLVKWQNKHHLTAILSSNRAHQTVSDQQK
jgi:hypothetical protein